MRVAGIDEAGKGPVIGPMVVCGISCDENDIKRLEQWNVQDSKKIDPREKREVS